jgi:hypothetical protein
VLVPENSDISLSQEFGNNKVWAISNKMVTNFSQTKEIFYRPNLYHSLCPTSLENIEQLKEAKLLGLIINNKFRFNSHIQLILRQCSQRLCLIKLLRKQGLPAKQLNIVFRAIIISRIQFAISVWGGFIHDKWKHKMDAFLTRANRSGLCTDLKFYSLLFAADQTFF